MTDSNHNLVSLFTQLDDWFQDLTLETPIRQFSLQDDDRAKLAAITRTTTNWFKSLTNPQITNDGIDDDENGIDNNVKNYNSDNEAEDSHLDTLAKDLELLLEEDLEPRPNVEQEYYFYNFYANDELALLDETIGHYFTIEANKKTKHQRCRQNQQLSAFLNNQFRSVVMPDHHSHEKAVVADRKQQQQNGCDLKKIQASMPPDHDYLPRPRPRPLVMSNRMMLRRDARSRVGKESSVLNTGAIKRFARFSDGLKILSTKHEHNVRLLAIENN